MAQYYPGLLIQYGPTLQHHGILGQKWGRRNGPPYPLGRSQKSSREKKMESKPQRSKEDILKDPTAHEVNKIRSELTNDQLQKVLERIDLNVRLEKALKSELNAGSKKEKSVFDTIDSLMNKVGKVNTWAEKGIKSYDLINQIIQIFNGVDMDKIKRMK